MHRLKYFIKKSQVSVMVIFTSLVVFNFCSLDAVAHHELVSEVHNYSSGRNYAQDSSHSHNDEGDDICCSKIKAIGVTTKKVVSIKSLKSSSEFLYPFQSIVRKALRVSLVQGLTQDASPPFHLFFKMIFLSSILSHAPPAIYCT